MRLCIFCDNPRTIKHGEHVWDNWLNREGGKDIRRPSRAFFYGVGGKLVREYPTDRLEVTLPVVCDPCNNEWMSDLSNHAKDRLEGCIRRDQPAHFDFHDILILTSFFFLKSAVLDWSVESQTRTPCISRANCLAFRLSLVADGSDDIALPLGLQVWIAHYRRTHVMEAQALIDELTGRGLYRGYRIVLITYVVGSFIFQLAFPRWRKRTRNRPAAPFFQMLGDVQSVAIWPGVETAHWPPPAHVDSRSLEIFRERFRRVTILNGLS